MQINVKVYATLREGHFKEEVTDVEEEARIIDVMGKYDISSEERICLVNGRYAETHQSLQNGDTVLIFPPGAS